MAKISAYSALTGANLATTDEFALVDKSDTSMAASGTDKRMVASELGIGLSPFVSREVQIQVTDPNGDALGTGDGQAYFRVPALLNGYNLAAVAAAVTTASSSGLPTVQIANVTDAVDMLSTRITIDANETDSSTADTAAVIDAAHDDVATADLLRVDIDVAGTGTKGLIVSLMFQHP